MFKSLASCSGVQFVTPFCRRYARAFACDIVGIWPFVMGIAEVPDVAAPRCAEGGLCWKFARAAAVAALTGVALERGGEACTAGDAEPLWFMKFA